MFSVGMRRHDPRFVDIVNYLVAGYVPTFLTKNVLKKFMSDIKWYHYDDGELFRLCADQIL